MTQLDLSFVRAQFPAFAVPVLSGQAFFENAGGSYPCGAVVDRLHRFYTERKVQPYAPYPSSELGGAEMDEARARLSALLGVMNDELSFGPSTSANTYVLSQAVRQWLSGVKGAAIVVTNQDHEANSGVWRRLSQDGGIEVREWAIDSQTGHLDPQDLEKLLADGRVKLVCFPHCSNVVAEINPVARICALAHEAGAYTCVDGVSYAPHGFVNIDKLGADVYLFSAYKTYGPHQGVMVIRHGLGSVLPAQAHFFNAKSSHKRFTPSGPDHAQVAACAGMVDYIDALYDHHFSSGASEATAPVARAEAVHDLMRDHETVILQPLLDYLAARNDLRLLGPRKAEDRAPTVAIGLNEDAEATARALARFGIMAGGGDFYAVRPLQAMGIDMAKGILRLSFVHYTKKAEIDQLITALDQVL
ncbi:MAG: selenocysteine lyase/cysteine desulfurase [Paracoccaceae bacterium]|jgi:selenocysteine lyase/cysteine desulfurase